MNPNQTANNFTALQEAMARRFGSAPSGAGMPGGMRAMNAPTPANPIFNAGQSVAPTPQPGAASPAAAVPQQNNLQQQVANAAVPGQVQALNQSPAPDNATFIIKALAKTLDKLVPDQNPPTVGAIPLGQ